MNLNGMVVGIPREIMPEENRVAATPETVARLSGAGGRVRIETGAGAGSHFADADYAAAGAEIVDDPAAVYGGADLVLKVKEPRTDPRSGRHEIDLMRPEQHLICFLHPAAPHNREMVRRLAARGVTALTLDGIPRMARTQKMDALSSMSLVAGYKGTLMAADALSKFVPLTAAAVGVVKPATFLVVGAGVCGLQAIATAKRLGAILRATDIRAEAREQAGSLGAAALDPGVPADQALGAGGYARALTAGALEREREFLRPHVADADLLILSALVPGRVAPVLVTDGMLSAMRPGSVVVDIAIDQGGNCAASEAGRVTRRHGVTVMAIENIPGRVPATATWLFAQNIWNFLEYLVQNGHVRVGEGDDVAGPALVTRGGRVVHAGTLEAWAAADAEGA